MTDKKMVSYTSDQIVDLIESIYLDKKIILLSKNKDTSLYSF